MTGVETPADSQISKRTTFVTLLVEVVAVVVIMAGLVFVLTAHLEWTLGWVYVRLFLTAMAINWGCVLRWNPVLIAVYVVAVIELGWVSVTPGAAWLLGLAIFVSGWALLTWSSVVNPFLEKTVRIQTEHGHRVIETGPYAYVRHPFYVGLALWMLSTPLLLISTWAFIPAVLAVVGLMIRTALEDRTLHRELPGYADYTVRIRFRLIPGVW